MRPEPRHGGFEAGAPRSIAVVIPVLNGEAHLAETLASVLAQGQVVSDIVVVDDGCSDNSVAIAESHPGVRVLRNPGRGVDSARRFGIDATSAGLVALLDHDDVWHPDHLATLLAGLDQYPRASAAVSYYRPFQDGGEVPFDAPVLDAEVCDPWSTFPGAITATPSAVVMRRAAIDAVGGWTTGEFGSAGDLYMWLRLAEWGPFVMNRRVAVGYRIHAAATSRVQLERAPLSYVDQVVRAASRATAERAARFPQDADWLARRRQVARAVRLLASGALKVDRRQVARGARLLEAGTVGEQIGTIKAAFDQVFWLIQGHGPAPKVYGQAWRALITGWPTSARRTAPYRLRFGTMRPLVRAALTRPAPWRWRWLIEAAWCRLFLEKEPTADTLYY